MLRWLAGVSYDFYLVVVPLSKNFPLPLAANDSSNYKCNLFVRFWYLGKIFNIMIVKSFTSFATVYNFISHHFINIDRYRRNYLNWFILNWIFDLFSGFVWKHLTFLLDNKIGLPVSHHYLSLGAIIKIWVIFGDFLIKNCLNLSWPIEKAIRQYFMWFCFRCQMRWFKRTMKIEMIRKIIKISSTKSSRQIFAVSKSRAQCWKWVRV